ncbi:Protein patched-like 2 [Stylophora pistillata]|uniref:Protein patched-like 2 n=1 Tax=Stylophora pistillata TaxID=50429 RepID=A0A2B4RKQ7_STYPI|nr:Protein patched-like 2 [Stylophora pistillata]
MGQQIALRLRSKLQAIFFKLGCFCQRNCWAVLAAGFFILIGLSVGIMTAKIETDVEKLWMEVDGRLEKELQYTKDSVGEGAGTTNELIIHAANEGGDNILSVDSMQEHLKAVQKAIEIKVDVFGKTWSHTDLCYVPEVPSFDNSLVDGLEWIESDPKSLLTLLDVFNIEGKDEITDLFVKAGINKGYQEKPCLDPTEPKCPSTAPNSPSKTGNDRKAPDVKSELNGGCKGFATEFMQWAEELIVGGATKNNNTLSSAKALQTILVLTGPQGLYNRWADRSQELNVDWNLDTAKQVLEAWQRRFTEEINEDVKDTDEFSILAFDSTSVTDLLKEFSETSVSRIAIGYMLMLIYACITLKRWCEPIRSHGALGFVGVLLVTLSVAAGLGFSALCGITFNAASTQVLPFLALGLGVDDMFLLAHSYSTLIRRGDIRHMEEVGYCLGTTGVSVFLTSFNNMLAFFMAALIPIPALRYFALQAAVVVIFNFFGVIIIFPAMLGVDVQRMKRQRYDIICCLKRTSKNQGSEEVLSKTLSKSPQTTDGEKNQHKLELSDGQTTSNPSNTIVMSNGKSDSSIAGVLINEYANNSDKQSKLSYDSETSMMRNHLSSNASQYGPPSSVVNSSVNGNDDGSIRSRCAPLSLQHFATVYYGPALQKMPVKVAVILFFLGGLAAGIYGAFQVEDGLEITEVVPRNSIAHKFVEAQFKYFSFYPMALVTQDNFDYANKQKTLLSYHEAFKQIPNVIRIPGSEEIPKFWLMYFREWLNDTQTSFDQDWADKTITYDGWTEAASSTGVMAYKLLSQTDESDNIDRTKVRNYKLVSDGIIRPEIFYKALTVWIDRDVLGYAFSQADIKPKTADFSNTRSPQDDKAMIAVSFLAMAVLLFNIWAAAVIVLVLAMITVEVYGFMGLAGIKLSAVPAVTLILSVGVGVEFTVHMCMAFLHAVGDRNQRMQKAIEHVFVPIVDGAISTFLGVVMMAGSEFEFIVRYFFNLLVALICIGTFNGLLFLPVFLSLAGPGAVATEVSTPNLSNSLAIQNQATAPSSAESAINDLELEEHEPSDVTKGNGKPYERTYPMIKHGAQVEPVHDKESRSSDMTTVEGPRQHEMYDVNI